MNIIQVLDNQRVYDTHREKTYTEMCVLYIIEWNDEQWGCVHVPKRQLLTTVHQEVKTIELWGKIMEYAGPKRKIHTPVYVESPTWMAVHRMSESETWLYEEGSDYLYLAELTRLGISEDEILYTHKHEPHVNEIPDVKYTLLPVTEYRPKQTAYRMLLHLADGWDREGRPWFNNDDSHVQALNYLRTHFPKAPLAYGKSMGYDEDSQSKDHMRMGWYIHTPE